MTEIKRLVVKVGSSTLTYPNGKPNLKRMDALCRVLADLRNRGVEVALVTSGAVSMGVGKLGLAARPTEPAEKQAAAAVGQVELMFIYDKFFSEYGQKIAQVLLTSDVVETAERRANVENCFAALMQNGTIPIINENDTVSIEELSFSENDTLSAVVAALVKADLLVLLSDIDGLYDKRPDTNPDAKLIPRVTEMTEEIRAAAGGSGSSRGSGGMAAKLRAAELAASFDVPMLITNGRDPEILYRIMDGEPCGTLFTLK